MKIFSLKTKKHLAGWSVVVGAGIFYIVNRLTLKEGLAEGFVGIPENTYYSGGWPFHYQYAVGPFASANPLITSPVFIYNLIFRIVVVLIVLSLLRRGRKSIKTPPREEG